MQPMDCCDSCSPASVDSIFPMGAYIPYKPGYGHTYSLGAYSNNGGNPTLFRPMNAYPSPSRPTGITPVGVAGPCAGEPVSRPCNWETATMGAYERGDGNPNPEYPIRGLKTVSGFDSGVQSMGVFPLVGWGVIAGLGALGILSTAYVADTAVENITTNPEITTPITSTITDTTKNLTNLAVILGITAIVFRKEIKKAIK